MAKAAAKNIKQPEKIFLKKNNCSTQKSGKIYQNQASDLHNAEISFISSSRRHVLENCKILIQTGLQQLNCSQQYTNSDQVTNVNIDCISTIQLL